MDKTPIRKLIPMAMLLIAGCLSTDISSDVTGRANSANDSITPPVSSVSVNSSMSGERRVEDSRIRVTYRDKGLQDISISDDADIRDIQAFAITAYRKALQGKLQRGDSLTKGEVELLGFICIVQHVAMASFTEYGYLH